MYFIHSYLAIAYTLHLIFTPHTIGQSTLERKKSPLAVLSRKEFITDYEMPCIILGRAKEKRSLVENLGILFNAMLKDQVPKRITASSMISRCLNTVAATVRKLSFSRSYHYFGVGNFS